MWSSPRTFVIFAVLSAEASRQPRVRLVFGGQPFDGSDRVMCIELQAVTVARENQARNNPPCALVAVNKQVITNNSVRHMPQLVPHHRDVGMVQGCEGALKQIRVRLRRELQQARRVRRVGDHGWREQHLLAPIAGASFRQRPQYIAVIVHDLFG